MIKVTPFNFLKLLINGNRMVSIYRVNDDYTMNIIDNNGHVISYTGSSINELFKNAFIDIFKKGKK